MENDWKELHTSSIVIDGHMDTLSLIHSQSTYGINKKRTLVQGGKDGHVNLARLSADGVNAAILATYVQTPFIPQLAQQHSLQMIGYAHDQIETKGDRLMLIKKASDIAKAKKPAGSASFLAWKAVSRLARVLKPSGASMSSGCATSA